LEVFFVGGAGRIWISDRFVGNQAIIGLTPTMSLVLNLINRVIAWKLVLDQNADDVTTEVQQLRRDVTLHRHKSRKNSHSDIKT
jgi:hypothetical protein